jgi:hypothetical protein
MTYLYDYIFLILVLILYAVIVITALRGPLLDSINNFMHIKYIRVGLILLLLVLLFNILGAQLIFPFISILVLLFIVLMAWFVNRYHLYSLSLLFLMIGLFLMFFGFRDTAELPITLMYMTLVLAIIGEVFHAK